MLANYCLHEFHWKPHEILEMSLKEKAFILASLELKGKEREKEMKKFNSKAPKRRR